MIVAYAIDGLWTLIALVGLGVSIWALTDGVIDRRERQRRNSDGFELVIVAMNLRSAHASLYLHAFFFVLGIFALTHPSPAEATPTYVLLVAGYIFVAATNVRSVGLNQLDRLRMRSG